jgi:hypothetical protein
MQGISWRVPAQLTSRGKCPDPELVAMPKPKNAAWARYLDDVSSELLRLSIACDLRLRDPGVVERILKNDETVCGARNPIGFQKLQHLLKFTIDNINKSVGRIGPDETKQIIDAITERLNRTRAIGGTDPRP